MKRLGGRKFSLMLLLLTVGLVVDLFTERGLSANYLTLMMSTAGAYIMGNSAAKFAERGDKTKPGPNEITPLKKQLASLSTQLAKVDADMKTAHDALGMLVGYVQASVPPSSPVEGEES